MTSRSFAAFRRHALFLQNTLGNASLLRRVESVLLGDAHQSEEPSPIFIVGPPRTGSTVLSQLFLASYRVSFLSNFQALFWGSPRLFAFLSGVARKQLDSSNINLDSTYGYVDGLWSPAEGGRLYREWFEQKSVPIATIQDAVHRMQQAVGGPFVSKNLFNSLRIDYIRQIFPKAFFVYVDRSPLWTAQSILLARRKLNSSPSEWLGPRPPGVADNLPEFESVARQIMGIHKAIQVSLSRIPNTHWIHIQYESLINNPYVVLELVAETYLQRLSNPPLVNLHRPLPDLHLSESSKLSTQELLNLEMAIESAKAA